MFERKLRLPATTKFTTAVSIKTSYCTILFASNSRSYNRYGFVTSKKVDKRAVVRNRAKRLVRTSMELLAPRLRQGMDFLCIIHKQAYDASVADITANLTVQFQNKGLL